MVDGVEGVTGAVVVTGTVTGAVVVTGTGAAVATGAAGVEGEVTAAAWAAGVVEANANKETRSTAVHCLWDLMILLANVFRCRGSGSLNLHAVGAWVIVQ